MLIKSASLNFEREPLAAPWGFKGGFLTDLWQTVVRLKSDSGVSSVGCGVQSVLWCDSRVFAAHSEAGGNALMFSLTDFAARQAVGLTIASPFDLIDRLLEPTLAYGRHLTGLNDLKTTFALNALVPIDHAIWRLFAAETGQTFDGLLPDNVRPALSHRSKGVVSIPAVGYGLSMEKIQNLASEGYFIWKIKVGSDPGQNGDLDAMLQWDCSRLTQIHNLLGSLTAPASPTGKHQYYLDANQRYDSYDRVMRLIDHLSQIGALEQTILLEEPFAEENKSSVEALPILVAADESAHTVEDTAARLDLGYGAVALKPIAKTMSMSLRVAELCHRRNIPAFCADLTVNPWLVEWNKLAASRLAPIPGQTLGLQETNGFQNYRDWDRLCTYLPEPEAPWLKPRSGVFELSNDYFGEDGGVFAESSHYSLLVPDR